MSTQLIVNASLPEMRVALLEEGEIQELLIERATGKGIVGNIYKGRVTRVLPGMQAAFVDIGLEKAAFLYVDDVFVHSEIWEAEEGGGDEGYGVVTTTADESEGGGAVEAVGAEGAAGEESSERPEGSEAEDYAEGELGEDEEGALHDEAEEQLAQHPELLSDDEAEEQMAQNLEDLEGEDEDSGEDDNGPVGMGREGGEDDDAGNRAPPETIAPPKAGDEDSGNRSEGRSMQGRDDEGSADDAGDFGDSEGAPSEGGEGAEGGEGSAAGGAEGEARRRHRRGRRGGRNRRGRKGGREGEGRIEGQPREARGDAPATGSSAEGGDETYPDTYYQQVSEQGDVESDRASVMSTGEGAPAEDGDSRPQIAGQAAGVQIRPNGAPQASRRPEFRETRSRDRKIRPKQGMRQSRANVNIQDLLKEGQEVIVQVAKDPIATKGARLTCHISLPGRHLVCMPTIDHVGVSRRIDSDQERRRLREFVDRIRPKGLGFIVRTATSASKTTSEVRVKQDVEYLSNLWNEIREKATNVSAPAMIYEDLNPVLRAIRDWVNDEIDKIVIDSRYHYNEVMRFATNFMPTLKPKVELYQGDVPIFDAYSISSELARALERKVWLKSGGYIVVDQAEALVAIDVNTGRYVGKKNLEDTILKTNLEAVKEIAYQLRLRNCGGIIILDLIDMEKEENKFRVYRALEEELKKDRARPQILKISELGLIEMTRKRTRDTMVRALCDACSHCEGKGFIKSKQTMAYEVLRDIEREGIDRDVAKILVQAHPDVVDQLAIDERESLDQLERRYRKTIFLQAVPDFHPEQFEVVSEKANHRVRDDGEILSRARVSAGAEDPRDRGRGRRGRRDEKRDERGRGRRGGRDRNDRNERGGGGREGGERNDRQQGERQSRDRQEGGRDRNEGGGNRERIGGRNRGERQDRHQGGGQIQENPNPISPVDNDAQPQIIGQAGGPPNSRVDGDAQPYFAPESNGNYEPNGNTIGGGQGQSRGGQDDDFMTEEDRLAYLRAQAAQDAAIAGVASGGSGNRQGQGQRRPNHGGRWGGQGQGGQGQGQGGGRDNRGGRGGRGRDNRGGQGQGQGGGRSGGRDNRGGRGGKGGGRFQGGGFRGSNDRPAPMGADSPGNIGGNGGGNRDGGGSGGTDTPPTT